MPTRSLISRRPTGRGRKKSQADAAWFLAFR